MSGSVDSMLYSFVTGSTYMSNTFGIQFYNIYIIDQTFTRSIVLMEEKIVEAHVMHDKNTVGEGFLLSLHG